MPQLAYTAISSRTGEMVRGQIEAATPREALLQLQAQGLIPLDVKGGGLLAGRRRRIPVQLVANTLQQMAQMLMIGNVPLAQMLASMADEQEHPGLRAVLERLQRSVVRDGMPLSQAMGAMPDVFPVVVVQRVAAGEKDGTLPEALQGAATYMVQMARARARILSAMSYPLVVLGIAVAIISGLSVTVMPRFAGYFVEAHVPLPLMTRLVLGFGQMLAHHAPLVILGLAAAASGAGRLLARQSVRDRLDRLLWNMPGWRRIVRHLAWARFAQTLGALYGHGVDILDALQLACDGAGTAVIRDAAPLVIARVTQSVPLSTALREAGVFSPRLVTIAAWGERHGTLDKMMLDAAQMYTHDVDILLEQIPQLVQPVLIVVIGAIVATFILAMYWPMFSLYNVIASGGLK
jgi:type II secretory pathway component PulF